MKNAITPLTPYDDRPTGGERDFAGAGAFSQYALERMLRDCLEQPSWRLRAKLCAAYYDGKQISELQRWALRQEDLEERAINLIRPVVNSVLGQEARSRTDVKVEADDDRDGGVAEVLSGKLKELERETMAHMAISEAYASAVKKGLGWVHVDRNADPLAYKYRVESVHTDEIWWDWRGQQGVVLDDRCRWLVRSRMIDLDEIEASFSHEPKIVEVLRRCAAGWHEWTLNEGNLLGEPESIQLREAWENERRFNVSFSKLDWYDSGRRMIKTFEVWYRVPATVAVLHLSPIKTVVYDPSDMRHVEAVSRGLVKVTKGVTSQVRRALYAGPHRLLDEATTRKRFPYIPMFAYRDDEDKSPYGLIDGMVAPQDEYNERRHRIQWLLKARQIQMDSDALDQQFNTIDDIAETVMRPDMVAITNPLRKNRGQVAIKITNELALQKEQFEVMGDSKQLIQDTAGRYSSQLGNAQVQSGIANSLLIEQGEQSMGELNDNYTTARRLVFEAGVDLIRDDLGSAPNLKVPVGEGKTRRIIVLNMWEQPTAMAPAVDEMGQPVVGPDGQPVMQEVPDGAPIPKNMVKDADVKTALADTPNTPAYRQQTQQQLKEIIQAVGANPQATAILTPLYIESTSLPNRQEAANQLRKASGLPLPGDKDAAEAAEQAQQQALQVQNELATRKLTADTDKSVAEAERARQQARYEGARADLFEQQAKAGKGIVEVEEMESRIAGNRSKTMADRMAAFDQAANEDEAIASAISSAMPGRGPKPPAQRAA